MPHASHWRRHFCSASSASYFIVKSAGRSASRITSITDECAQHKRRSIAGIIHIGFGGRWLSGQRALHPRDLDTLVAGQFGDSDTKELGRIARVNGPLVFRRLAPCPRKEIRGRGRLKERLRGKRAVPANADFVSIEAVDHSSSSSNRTRTRTRPRNLWGWPNAAAWRLGHRRLALPVAADGHPVAQRQKSPDPDCK
jgi:hypothetical protein